MNLRRAFTWGMNHLYVAENSLELLVCQCSQTSRREIEHQNPIGKMSVTWQTILTRVRRKPQGSLLHPQR